MTKRIYCTAALVLSLLSCSAQRTEKREISSFTSIETKGALKVIFRQSDSLQLTVKAQGNDLEKITTEVSGGVLRISGKGEAEDAVVTVTAPELTAIDVQGATSFRTDGSIRASEFEVNISGAATGNLALEAREIICIQSGASNLTLSGSTNLFKANVSGASTLKAFDMQSAVAEVETSGAANAKITARERFNGNASGASSIKLQGEPTDVIAEASSAASITRVKSKTTAAGSDTVTYNWNNKKIIIVDDGKKEDKTESKRKKTSSPGKYKHWRGVMLGANGYVDQSGNIEMPSPLSYMELNYARSFNIQVNPIERQFYIAGHYLKLVTGLGLDLHRYELLNKSTLNPDSSFTYGTIDSSNMVRYERNKLRATYLQVPLLLEFNTSSNYKRTFHVAVGVVGQYRIGASTRQLLQSGGYEIERLNKDDYNLNPFGAKAHLNFGYRGWTLYAEYSLTTLFKPGKGPELYPFTAGLRILPFS